MGTELAISYSNLQSQLETEKSSLCKIDESIKRTVQTPARYFNDRYTNATGEYARTQSRLGPRNAFPDSPNNSKNDENIGKRKLLKTVFSRLSGAGDSDAEEGSPKRVRMSSAVSRELPSRADVVAAQAGDRARNKRMFGSLLGTLHKFKQEEITLQNKEDKKAQVERKIEEQARQQKEKEIKERKSLFAERDHKKSMIKALEIKMTRMAEFENFRISQQFLANFIRTKATPAIYWLPRKMSTKTQHLLDASRIENKQMMQDRQTQMEADLLRIEQRCLKLHKGGDNRNADGEHNQDESAKMDAGENEPKTRESDFKRRDRNSKTSESEVETTETHSKSRESEAREDDSKTRKVESKTRYTNFKDRDIDSKNSDSKRRDSKSKDIHANSKTKDNNFEQSETEFTCGDGNTDVRDKDTNSKTGDADTNSKRDSDVNATSDKDVNSTKDTSSKNIDTDIIYKDIKEIFSPANIDLEPNNTGSKTRESDLEINNSIPETEIVMETSPDHKDQSSP